MFLCSHCIYNYTDINSPDNAHAFLNQMDSALWQGITKVIRFTLHTKVFDNATSFRSEKVLRSLAFYGTYIHAELIYRHTCTRADTHFKTYQNFNPSE